MSDQSQFLLYTAPDGAVKVDVFLKEETVWLTQKGLAENRAERGILMKMADWITFLHSFLELSNYPILQDKGKVSALEARLKAEGEFETYRQRQDAEYISDFDREVKRLEGTHRDQDATNGR